MNFLKSFLASCLGSMVAIIALILLCVMLVASLSNNPIEPLGEDSILHLKLESPISAHTTLFAASRAEGACII